MGTAFFNPGTYLSQESMEICTESLGSETGSEFNLSPFSTIEDEEERKEEAHQFKDQEQEEETVVRKKETAVRSFPPPLSSLLRPDGQCLNMVARRHGGRLIVEAVSAPSQSFFCARRHHGRLLLSFVDQVNDDGNGGIDKIGSVESEEREMVSGGSCGTTGTTMKMIETASGRQRVMNQMRRCSELRRPFFSWEQSCTVTT